MCQSAPQRAIHGLFEWLACAADLLLEQGSNVIVNRQSRSHIMTLAENAS